MLTHEQTIVGTGDAANPPGNCLQAALASLLDLPLAMVPHIALFDSAWGEAVVLWLRARGKLLRTYNDWPDHQLWWAALGIECNALDRAPSGQLMIASGHSPNGPWGHSVLWRADHIVHDPHPGQKGIVGRPYEFWQITDVSADTVATKEGEY